MQLSDDEVAQYYREHEAEFTRGGELTPFDEAEPVARQRASAERRRATIDQWLRDLRARADISINPLVRTPVDPVVFLDSRSRCACTASFSG